MNRELRTAVVAGGAALFGVGLLLGFLLGRSANDEEVAAPPATPDATTTATLPTVLSTPPPGEAPAISTEGQVLQDDRTVFAAPSNAACTALLSPGTIGDCNEVVVAGQRVVWVVEQATTPTGAPAFSVRISTFVPDEGGWVQWLEASDPAGERWSEVNVLAADLTSDGVAELLVGFRSVGEAQTLDYDIVGYSESVVPEVLAYPEPTTRGSVIVSAGTIQEYGRSTRTTSRCAAPATYLRRTIAFEDSNRRRLGDGGDDGGPTVTCLTP